MIVASSPKGKVYGTFRPREKFNWVEVEGEDEVPVLKAIYLPKFDYTVRTELLLKKAREWHAAGKVVLVEE
jgi:hypothetical protein